VSQPTRNLFIISDIHCGCQLGLIHPAGIQLDEGGGRYVPSPIQTQTYKYWKEMWEEWLPLMTHGEPYDIVFNGDAVDGSHHNATHQITHNLHDQVRMARDLLSPRILECRNMGGNYYHIRGTEAHVGSSGVEEERLAELIEATPNEQGQFARFELWKRVGKGLVHCLHHIGTTGSQAYEATAVNKELTESFTEAGRWGNRPPDIVVRSHRHRAFAVMMPTSNAGGEAWSLVTPGWQAKTPFVWRIPGGRLSSPQFGGILIRQHDDGALRPHFFVRSFPRSDPE